MTLQSPEDRLARFAHAPVRGDDARAMMRLSLFDWAVCGLAGVAEPVSGILRAKALGEGGRGDAALFGGGRVPARAAALVNGTISHALDFDDTHFAHIGHCSVGVLPAALALGEGVGAELSQVVDAALVGVEAAVRVGVWLGRGHYEVGFHQTATAGAFGATLAAARLLGLDHGQTIAAIGLASTRASGLKSQFGTMGKPYNAGLSAETGVEAALLARAGMTSTSAGLSGAQGFGATHCGGPEGAAFDPSDDTSFDGMGEAWRFERVSHKFHACCHGLHAMIEATLALGLQPDEVAAVEIRTHPRWLTVCNAAAPTTGLGAKFSYRLTCAMAIAGADTSAIATFSDAITRRPDLIALRDRVGVTGDRRVSEMQSVVTVKRADGSTVTGRYDLDAPMPLAARAAKLRRKGAGLLGAERAEALFSVTSGDDLAALVAALGQA